MSELDHMMMVAVEFAETVDDDDDVVVNLVKMIDGLYGSRVGE